MWQVFPMDHFPPKSSGNFETTHWSLVSMAQASSSDAAGAQHALETLCGAYWYPIYSFVRHQGHSPEDAQDLTQSFLAEFIERQGFASADRDRGRFRTYLLGALKHFLANEWHRNKAIKRGGGINFLEWDNLQAEARYALEPAELCDPEMGYDREWALQLIERAKAALRQEAISQGNLNQFEVLKGCLGGGETPRIESAKKLGLSEGAIKTAVHRLRQRYRTLIRAEVAETVQTRSEIDSEMRYLVSVLRKQ
jgi:RNA polymerase sigma-70 factor (ECF subfamily)